MNYAFQGEGESLAAALAREAGKAAARSYVDYSFHPVITHVDEAVLGEFEAIRDDGFSSVKVFTAVPDFEVADRDVLAILRRASETGLLVNVHAEDGARGRSTRFRRLGRMSPRDSPRRSSGSTVARRAARSTSSISRRLLHSKPLVARVCAAPRSTSRRARPTSFSTSSATAFRAKRHESSSPGRR